MSSVKISETIMSKVSKGPLLVLVVVGLGLWQVSYMTAAQIDTVEHLVAVLSNLTGFFIGMTFLLLLFYALILWPVGSYIGSVSREFIKAIETHEQHAATHHEASKAMYHDIAEMKSKIENFYGGKD